ncbi:Fc.00g038900.m01.CDS01 [Cosmosporella sp. VM-42]
MNDASSPPIYPRYCFNLAPTVNSWCFLHITEVRNLAQHPGFEGESFFFYKSLPIKWVRIVGIVVAVDDYTGRRVYTVDDSSGACIECMLTIPIPPKEADDVSQKGDPVQKALIEAAKPPPVPQRYVDIDVGSVVDVKGGLSIFRDEKQIDIEKLTAVKSTAEEVALWEKKARFRKDVLNKPWVLSNKEIRRCRKEAERSEEEAERKQKRLKARIEGQVVKEPVKLAKELSQQSKRDGKKLSRRSRPDLRQIIQNGATGKYDALGL